LIFNIAAKNENVLLVAPNFLAVLEKGMNDITGEERWVIKKAFDSRDGLFTGIPSSALLSSINSANYAISAIIGLKNDEGTQSSALEAISSDGTISILDTGSGKTRLEDGAGNHIAIIEPLNKMGGVLYLSNAVEKKKINTDANAYVSNASYDGTNLAYVWTKNMLGWTLSWQKKEDDATKGDYNIPLSGDSRYFTGFPDIGTTDIEATKDVRKIADLAFSDKKLFVLLYGFYEGKHYYQAAVYTASLNDGKYLPTLAGYTSTISFSGNEADKRARFQRITKNSDGSFTALFSSSGGLRKFTISPSSPPAFANIETIFSASNIIDLDIDDSGELFAFISGKTIRIRNLSNPNVNITATSVSQSGSSESFEGASIILHSKWLFLSTPKGASSPFWVIDVSNPQAPELKMKCNLCDFNGLTYLAAFEDNLFASSETDGIEIYDVSNLE